MPTTLNDKIAFRYSKFFTGCIFSACKCSEAETCGDSGPDQPRRVQAEEAEFLCTGNRSPGTGTRDARHVVCAGQCDAVYPVLSHAPGHGGRDVRDGGLGQSEEREACGVDPSRGGKERGQDWHACSHGKFFFQPVLL